ncbi:hypothetical protein M422DRAFT_34810 [Sphaerobolus stellatus SS14]|uniref:Unplaced genomic scaffold SPHSTscaffold_117, whole genome shotgun sequence n=1 Tax=Sphaerobolus stellatus (strain SS14) TaxID=990650 RepID=A0A0C9VC52_SPHS4|nr:hypothetical protein M422DRAFT_34810 [Sphaerobolus stellatus SS14]
MIRHLSLLDYEYSFFNSVREHLPRYFQNCPLDSSVQIFESPTSANILESLPMAIKAKTTLKQFSWHYIINAPVDLSKCIYPALQYVPPLRLDVAVHDEASDVVHLLRGVYPASITHLVPVSLQLWTASSQITHPSSTYI